MNFKRFLENLDNTIWGNLPKVDGKEIDTIELYNKQNFHNKKVMEAQRKEDKSYLENLKKSINLSGIKTPILVNKEMIISDGLHRLIAAMDLNLPTVPVKII